MKVVVTGGAGQLGTRVLERLVTNPEVKKIVCLDIQPPIVPSPKLTYVHCDVSKDELAPHFESADSVVHLAFMLFHRGNPARMWEVNVQGSQRVFEAAVQAGVASVIYSSSVAAYGIGPGLQTPLTEDHPRTKKGLLTYSEHKVEVEELLDGIEQAHPQVRFVRLRPGVLLGRNVEHPFAAAFNYRIAPELADCPGPAVWDEDVAQAVWLGVSTEARGAFNMVARGAVGGRDFEKVGFKRVPLPEAFGSTYKRLFPLLGLVGADQLDPEWLMVADIPMEADNTRAIEVLGWRPECPTGISVLERFARETPYRLDPRLRLFFRGVNDANQYSRRSRSRAGQRESSGRVHLALIGERGGDLTVLVQSGRVQVKRGIPRPPQSTVVLTSETLLGLLAGRLQLAAAHEAGLVRSLGEPFGLLTLGAIIDRFRDRAAIGGTGAAAVKVLGRWFERNTWRTLERASEKFG